jgi:hypothetical protein
MKPAVRLAGLTVVLLLIASAVRVNVGTGSSSATKKVEWRPTGPGRASEDIREQFIHA